MSEQRQTVAGGPGTPGHPEIEELAALIDGMCGTSEASRLRAHLASCSECYEVFAETLHLLEDLRMAEEPPKVVSFPKLWSFWSVLRR
jgi:anti-sigma factor RsiW